MKNDGRFKNKKKIESKFDPPQEQKQYLEITIKF